MSQLNSPGPNNNAVGKPTSGKQDQGSNIDVKIYSDLPTNVGPKTPISTEFECAFGDVPTGKRTGGI